MRPRAEPQGALYSTRGESDICELSLDLTGLRVVVATSPHESLERLFVEYHFSQYRGFRFLDEGDLARYWESDTFRRGFHLFKIFSGGWLDQERILPGMLSTTAALGTCPEYFVCTTNGCLNVLSSAPLIREFI